MAQVINDVHPEKNLIVKYVLATHAIKMIITCLKRRTNKAREPIIVELIFLGPRSKGNHSQVIVE